MSSPNEAKLDMAVDAIRGAMTNIRVALQLIGEMRSEGQKVQPADPDRPKTFGARKREQAQERPTTAVQADSQQTEG